MSSPSPARAARVGSGEHLPGPSASKQPGSAVVRTPRKQEKEEAQRAAKAALAAAQALWDISLGQGTGGSSWCANGPGSKQHPAQTRVVEHSHSSVLWWSLRLNSGMVTHSCKLPQLLGRSLGRHQEDSFAYGPGVALPPGVPAGGDAARWRWGGWGGWDARVALGSINRVVELCRLSTRVGQGLGR